MSCTCSGCPSDSAEVWKSRGGDFFWSVIQITAQKKAVQIVTQTAQYTDSALSMAVLQKRRGHPQLEWERCGVHWGLSRLDFKIKWRNAPAVLESLYILYLVWVSVPLSIEYFWLCCRPKTHELILQGCQHLEMFGLKFIPFWKSEVIVYQNALSWGWGSI